MPEKGIKWLERKDLMTYEEMYRISALLVHMGIKKIRITGGEPFVRKDLLPFLHKLAGLNGLAELSITTNGVLTAAFVPELKKLGIRSVNLSLDTLDRDRFFSITHRDELHNVLDTLDTLLRHDIEVKINAVVMQGKNIDDIIPLVSLTKDLPVDVRFIEEMPFNGEGNHYASLYWNHVRILEAIKDAFPQTEKLQDKPYSTSYNYHIPGHKGNVGIIAAYTRSFCGTCNRVRITPEGILKTCLYDDGVMNLKDKLRSGMSDAIITSMFHDALAHRQKTGWDAEKNRAGRVAVHESMATIGG